MKCLPSSGSSGWGPGWGPQAIRAPSSCSPSAKGSVLSSRRAAMSSEGWDTHWDSPWGAQETLLPSFRCLPLAASEEQWPTWPQLFSAQQEHPSLMLTGRSHHKAADVLHFCSKCLRKSKKLSSLQLPQALPKPAAELCKLRHRMRLASIPKDWAKLAPDSIRAALGPDTPVIFSIRVPQQSLVLEVTHRSCVGDTYGVWRWHTGSFGGDTYGVV